MVESSGISLNLIKHDVAEWSGRFDSDTTIAPVYSESHNDM